MPSHVAERISLFFNTILLSFAGSKIFFSDIYLQPLFYNVPTLEVRLIALSFTCSMLHDNLSSICFFSSFRTPSILTESKGCTAQK